MLEIHCGKLYMIYKMKLIIKSKLILIRNLTQLRYSNLTLNLVNLYIINIYIDELDERIRECESIKLMNDLNKNNDEHKNSISRLKVEALE
jgi:hypothetical protein